MFNFSNTILENIKYRKQFNENAFSQGKLIFEYCSKEVKNFDDIFTKAIPKCLECFMISVNEAVNILTEKGIYDYDSKFFTQRFGLSDVFINDIEPLISKRSEIDEFASQLEVTKNIQRSSRGKWQGGGFGFKGAIKGAVTAGLLNAGTGILRGIGDSIADSVGDRRINSLKKEAFEKGNYDELLCDSIYKLNVLTGYYLCIVLAEHGKISKVINIVDEEDLSRKINNIRLQASKFPSQIKNLVSQINSWISENPFSFKYYSCLYALLGKKDNSISQICSALGYEKELEEYKKSVAESLVLNLKNSEDNVEEKIKMLQHIKNTYELFEIESKQIENLEYNLKSQKKSEDEITEQLNKNSYEESKADELITQGQERLEEVWAMLNGENALIEYKLTQYYKNLVKIFIDRRDFAGIERKIPYVYEQYDNGNPYAIYLISDIRREVYKRLGDNNKIIKTDEKILRLAKGGQISACAQVGFLCLNGYGYFKKDYEEAFKYLSIAAEKNQPMAMAWLGDMYLNGYGVEKDRRLAEKWLKLSAYYGHPYAIKQLEKL